MKKALVILLMSALPSLSLATRVSLFPVVLEHRYIENENSDLVFRRANSFSGLITFGLYQLGLDASNWSTESTASLLKFQESYREVQTSHLFKMGSLTDWLHVYSGIGVGIYESNTTTTFNGLSTETKSGTIMMASGIASVQVTHNWLHIALDLKLILSKDSRPNPSPAGVIKVGIAF